MVHAIGIGLLRTVQVDNSSGAIPEWSVHEQFFRRLDPPIFLSKSCQDEFLHI